LSFAGKLKSGFPAGAQTAAGAGWIGQARAALAAFLAPARSETKQNWPQMTQNVLVL